MATEFSREFFEENRYAFIYMPDRVLVYDIYAAYEEKYKDEQFVRLLPLGAVANLRNVKYTNMCEISLHIDERTNTLIVVSTIDNMVKGAAGQAVQNMNIMFSLDEKCGI